MIEIETIIDYCILNKRICPQPQIWNILWEMLENKKRENNSWTPSLPLILNAWQFTDDSMKRERFFEHLKWADNQNQLEKIALFLFSLNEDEWFYE